MKTSTMIWEQLRRNAVALISLAIAITSLGYNTWRNEASENNRNQRLVSIQILVMLGDLQQVILDVGHGENDEVVEGQRRKGWAISKTLLDISMVAEGNIPHSAQQLHDTWAAQSQSLRDSAEVQAELEAAVDAVRSDTHAVLRSLD